MGGAGGCAESCSTCLDPLSATFHDDFGSGTTEQLASPPAEVRFDSFNVPPSG